MRYSKITFVCPCYNHEKYVLFFLKSLIEQTENNWELIIIDDFSSDKSVELINSIQDKRITLLKNSFNMGINANVSRGISLAKTDIISFVASDDILLPNYVETVLDVFNNTDVDVCYSPLKHIDQNGNMIKSENSLPYSCTEFQILEGMFLQGNLLPSPGMAFKKSVFLPYLPLDISMLQYSDYQMHLYVLIFHKIKMLRNAIVLYRVTGNSTSSRSKAVILREKIETKKLMDTFVRLFSNNLELFYEVFGNNPVVVGNNVTTETINYWLGRIALSSSNKERQDWGLSIIMDFIAQEENLKLLHSLYNFSFKDYLKLSENVLSKSPLSDEEKKIKKYKSKLKRLQFTFFCFVIIFFILYFFYILNYA
ncbi:Glycosyl transferase family 2 [Succinivibrio dextrinosolvens DSM 3072]|uniref:Glycosyl transferase family 2 n=1 Tax=Succinivibrio dextrinosolvens DSM 3072 TaxID=1123324 RepID=A0A1T4VBK2_9GAMM|nr:glycosyltransferase [Succinivibrio dextrinosolvens]SKA62334.1 Glycosyl transferase family 2 [Succinivibrio dextrinosolvens DSM 3072]